MIGRVRFAGEPVAAVAADTLEEARAAVAAIVVDYAPLPGVFDPEAALRDDAPLVHPEWEQYTAAAMPLPSRAGSPVQPARML